VHKQPRYALEVEILKEALERTRAKKTDLAIESGPPDASRCHWRGV
jgi:hypothetical protein